MQFAPPFPRTRIEQHRPPPWPAQTYLWAGEPRNGVRIGRTLTWPPGDKPAYDRVIELYFDSVEAIDMAFLSPQGKGVLEGFAQKGLQIAWVALRNQELFFSQEADQPEE